MNSQSTAVMIAAEKKRRITPAINDALNVMTAAKAQQPAKRTRSFIVISRSPIVTGVWSAVLSSFSVGRRCFLRGQSGETPIQPRFTPEFVMTALEGEGTQNRR